MRRLLLVPLVIFAGVCSGKETFGSWTLDATKNGEWMYAFTANDAGEAIGRWCEVSTGECYWSIGTRAACNFGDTMPVLLSISPRGATSMRMSCLGQLPGVQWAGYKLDDPRLLDYHSKESLRVTFCAPIGVSDFHVMGFSMAGGRAATLALEERIADRPRPFQ